MEITKIEKVGTTSRGDIKVKITLNTGSVYRTSVNVKRQEFNSAVSELSPVSIEQMDKEIDFILASEEVILQFLSSNKDKKFYATCSHKITNRVIQRQYEYHPDPNVDGTIDDLKAHFGKFYSLCGFQCNSKREAEQQFKKMYPSVYKEDEVQIQLRPMKEKQAS